MSATTAVTFWMVSEHGTDGLIISFVALQGYHSRDVIGSNSEVESCYIDPNPDKVRIEKRDKESLQSPLSVALKMGLIDPAIRDPRKPRANLQC